MSSAVGRPIYCRALNREIYFNNFSHLFATGLRKEFPERNLLREIEIEQRHLQKEIDRLVRVIYIVALTAAVAVAVIYGFTRHDCVEGSLAGIAASMALIPEEFPSFTRSFAIGA